MDESGGDKAIAESAYDSDGELGEEHIFCAKCGDFEARCFPHLLPDALIKPSWWPVSPCPAASWMGSAVLATVQGQAPGPSGGMVAEVNLTFALLLQSTDDNDILLCDGNCSR